MKKYNVIFIILITIIISGCITCSSYKLQIINNRKSIVYIRLLSDTNSLYSDIYVYKINQNDTFWPEYVKSSNPKSWDDAINSNDDSSLYVYIFDYPKITEEIIKNKNYKLYKLKVKDLDSMNWTLIINDSI